MKNVFIRGLLFAGLALVCAEASAVVDAPSVGAFVGTGYQPGGWFTCETDINKDGKYLQFKELGDFLLSPRYPAPIRKIVLSLRCSNAKPTKKLLLLPFVNGVEDGSLVRTNETVAEVEKFEIVSFDLETSAGVDAFRLLQGGSGSTGNWGLNAIYVFHGEKTADEDEILREFAQQLPAPENLRLEDLADSRFSLCADSVEAASGYRFEVCRLTGMPRTERIERFAGAPEVDPASGWTFDPSATTASLDKYTSSGNTDGDDRSLKIDKNGSAVLLSPVCPERITEYSFMYKAGSSGKSNALAVYGRAVAGGPWTQIGNAIPSGEDTSKHQVSETLGEGDAFVQLKLVFEPGTNATMLAVDSLRVVYGGNEARAPVKLPEDGSTALPEITVENLAFGRYAYRIMATGGAGDCRDSSWSEEGVVDLAWAGIAVSAPSDVVCTPSGSDLSIAWTAVENAVHYLVTVVPTDDPENPVVENAKTTACTLSVPVLALGQYRVEVTAVSPGGVSRATATVEDCEMTLGKVAGLAAEAVAVDAVKAKWNEVPLAEGYQAKLFRVTGSVGSAASDYSGIADGIWPEGWTHYDTATYSGPVPKLQFRTSWIATCAYPEPVTSFTCRFRSHVESPEAAADVAQTFIRVDVSTSETGDSWMPQARYPVTTSMQTVTESIDVGLGVRRIRFAVDYDGDNPKYTQLNIEFGKVAVSYGAYERTEVASTGTKDCEADFRGLDSSGRYVVEVVPQPSGTDEGAAVSGVVDLSAEHFRKTGAVSLAGLRRHLYEEDFSSLADDARDTDLAKVHLDYWQFFKGTGEAEKLLYAKTSKSTGGVYAFGDPAATDSFCIGTLATKTIGCSLGIAFLNDTDAPVGAPTLTFDSIQRTFKANPAVYVLEWRVTDGATSIGTEGEWTPMTIPETAPYTVDTQGGLTEYRVTGITVTPGPSGRIQPGQAIIFRWRHANLSSGPMMAIDNVKLEFPVTKGFGLTIR